MTNISSNTSYTPSPVPDIPGPFASPTKPIQILPANSCDTHAHVFGPIARYPYSTSRQYTPPDASLHKYVGLLKYLGFSRAVLVQPSVYGLDNSRMLSALEEAAAEKLDIGFRGIAVIDPKFESNTLEHMHTMGVRGVRINLVFEGAESRLDDIKSIVDLIKPFGWHVQFLIDISQISDLTNLFGSIEVPVVVDHMGHFDAGLGVQNTSFQNLLALVQEGNTWVKLSGPNRISNYAQAPFLDVRSIAEKLIELAPDRMVFGTDWPHVKVPTPIPDDGKLIDELFAWAQNDSSVLHKVLVQNPKNLYGF